MSTASLRLLALAAALLVPAAAAAHEFWIAPLSYQLSPGEPLVAELRIGQDFKGNRISYLPARFFSFDIVNGEHVEPVRGRAGDLPAIKGASVEPGLNVITHYAKPSHVTYDEFGLFERFVRSHGLDALVDRHRARGLRETGFTERFRRCAKSLVQVGDEPGGDRLTGLPYELVAEANPYLDGVAELPVRLYWNGAPEPDTMIHVFTEGQEGYTRIRTDGDGRARVPLTPGATYLLNAVHMVERTGKANENHAVWESYWASLTFAVPR